MFDGENGFNLTHEETFVLKSIQDKVPRHNLKVAATKWMIGKLTGNEEALAMKEIDIIVDSAKEEQKYVNDRVGDKILGYEVGVQSGYSWDETYGSFIDYQSPRVTFNLHGFKINLINPMGDFDAFNKAMFKS